MKKAQGRRIDLKKYAPRFALLSVLLFIAPCAFAQNAVDGTAISADAELQTESRAKLELPAYLGAEGDDVVTNRKLRAQTGSLSKWSVSTSFGYNGGSIDEPIGSQRPNISEANASSTALQTLSGGTGIRYRLNKASSLLANVGVNAYAPFQSTYHSTNVRQQQNFDQLHGTVTLSDPSLAYARVFNAFGAQNYVSVSQTVTTDPGLRRSGWLTNTAFGHTLAYEIGTSKATAILFYGFNYGFFDRSSPEIAAGQTEYAFGFSPSLEYAINDTFNMSLSVSQNYEHTRDRSAASSLKTDMITSTFGIGIAVARDIFLFPNIQFIPDDIRAERTNVGLATNINLF